MVQKVRIQSDGTRHGTRVTNLETNEPVLNAKRVVFDHDAKGMPQVRLELLFVAGQFEIDVLSSQVVTEVEVAEVLPCAKQESAN